MADIQIVNSVRRDCSTPSGKIQNACWAIDWNTLAPSRRLEVAAIVKSKGGAGAETRRVSIATSVRIDPIRTFRRSYTSRCCSCDLPKPRHKARFHRSLFALALILSLVGFRIGDLVFAQDGVVSTKTDPGTAIETRPTTAKVLELESTLDASFDTGPNRIQLNLGRQLCGERLKVQWTLDNRTGKNFECVAVSSGCGCISEMPTNILVPKDTKKAVNFFFQLPSIPETLERQIILRNAAGIAIVEATLKSEAIFPLKLKNRIEITDESPHTLSIPYEASSEKADLASLQVSIFGGEIVTSTTLDVERAVGKVSVDVDPKRLPIDFDHAVWEIETVSSSGANARMPLDVRYTNRQLITLERTDEKNASNDELLRAIVWSEILPDLLRKGFLLKCYWLDASPSKLTSEEDIRNLDLNSKSTEPSSQALRAAKSKHQLLAKVIDGDKGEKGIPLIIAISSEEPVFLPQEYYVVFECGPWRKSVRSDVTDESAIDSSVAK